MVIFLVHVVGFARFILSRSLLYIQVIAVHTAKDLTLVTANLSERVHAQTSENAAATGTGTLLGLCNIIENILAY